MKRALAALLYLACGCREHFSTHVDGHTGDTDSGSGHDAGSDGGFDPAWAVSQTLRIRLPTGDDLHDFPVLVRLSNGVSDFGRIATDAHDLRFVDATGAVLAQDIELATSDEITVWVKVPDIHPGQDIELTVYSGNPNAPDLQSAASETWSESFEGVFHLEDKLEDATANHNAASDVSTTRADGVVARARNFVAASGSKVPINTAGFPVLVGGRTLCAWGKPAGVTGTARYLAGYGTTGADEGFYLANVSNALRVGGSSDEVSVTEAFADSRWNYVCATWNNPAVTVYVDGVERLADSRPAWKVSAGNGAIGNWDGAGGWDGAVDEVRVSSVARPAAWIAAEYRTMTADDATWGPSVTR